MSELIEAFDNHFRAGGSFKTIVEARHFAAPYLHQESVSPGSPQAKQVDEAVEAALVRVAGDIVAEGGSPQETFRKLVELHDRQPALNVRSSTSVSQQAYSTPLPIAYMASVLAKTTAEKTVYEPSAGHGALLMGSNASNVTVNELNPERAKDLSEQGYTVTQKDAAEYLPEQQHDIVIMNPPFGTVEEKGEQRKFQFGDFRTNQIDHAIALKSLGAMKPDGRAVLILGGKMGVEDDKRSNRYNTRESRGFYYTLYRHYNVTEHLSVHGNLYRKQGAGFPIDMIVVEGKGKSAKPLPAAEVPRLYQSFEELEGYLDDFLRTEPRSLGTTGRGEDIRGSGAERANHNQSSELPAPTLPSPGMVNRSVDGGSGGGDAGTNPRDDDETQSGSIHRHETSDPTNNPHTSNPSTVEDRLGTVSSDGKRFAASAAANAADIVSGTHTHQSPGEGGRIADVPDPGRTADAGGVAAGGDRADAAVESSPKQVAYHPTSNGRAIGTLVPANMQTGMTQALLRLERNVGNLDIYVTDRLAYKNPEELHHHFSGEQIDAIALSISNLERGSGFVLGDQTGIGKGRVVAAMIRYAVETGRTPIFVTKDAPLYADMVRDLSDIGMPRFRPLVTNPDLKVPLPDGRTLQANKHHNQTLKAMQQQGHIDGYDAIFTTYTQMQTVKGKEPERRQFLRTFAPNSILILDESHEAGGSTTGQRKPQAVGNRADFVRELAGLAQGVVYSSATYAKDPAVMDLYSRTDMKLALSNMENLTELVASGGVPLQQTLAAMLTEAGQYVRRERSFEGVSFEPVVVPVNRDNAENIARIMSEIMEFDRLKQRVVKGMDKDLKAEAKAAYGDNSTGKAGASSTNFTSLMHNVIGQMLFALKADETVERCLELLKKPQAEKPVLALSNTMGSLIGNQAELHGLQTGDELEVDFGALLHRYLERSREVMIGNPWGEKSRKWFSDGELGDLAVAKYRAVEKLITDTDFSDIPISPIDYISSRLNREGFRVGEVTGREHIAVYDANDTTLYQRRSGAERTKEAAVRTVKAFNDGNLDVIILNRSGSTGISLHASEKFKDQKQRHMIVVQAEPDINQFMQMLGRVHRTGQVITPNFSLLMADIPAEKRPGAVLAKKMASLNANTTAARSGGFSLGEIPDFMNEYGDRVVADIMRADSELHQRLDNPLEGAEGFITDGAIRRVTGRIPLLPISDQENLYDRIERQYTEYVKAQQAMGESVLEASTLDLDAITLARMEVQPADTHSQSPFTGAVFAEIVDTKAPSKPYTTQQVMNKLCKVIDLPSPADTSAESLAAILEAGQEKAQKDITALNEAAYRFKLRLSDARGTQVDNSVTHIAGILEQFPTGQPICLGSEQDEHFFGVVGDIRHTGLSSNPAAASSWEVTLYLADSMRELQLPLSRLNNGKENAAYLEAMDTNQEGISVYQLFDDLQHRTREKRQIFTGNLLRAWEKFPGQMVNFTDVQGNIRQGLLTRRGFDVEAALEHMAVKMPTVEDAYRYLTEHNGELKSGDKRLTIKADGDGEFTLQTPKAKDAGGKYYLDEALLETIGSEFYSVADRMKCSVHSNKLEDVLTYLMRERDYALAASDNPQKARELLGLTLPSFVETKPPEPPAIEMTEAAIPSGETVEAETPLPPPEPIQASDADIHVPSPEPEATAKPPPEVVQEETPIMLPQSIAAAKDQSGTPEKNVAKLLNQGDLLEALMEGESFHQKVENEPFMPLVIERHDNQLYLTHYYEENFDLIIDSEMVFSIDGEGKLSLEDTAVTAMGGEFRYCDRSFANMFSRNLIDQGFGEAIAQSRDSPRAEESIQQAESQDVTTLEDSPTPSPTDVAVGDEPQKEEEREDKAERRDTIEPPPISAQKPTPPTKPPTSYPTANEVSIWAMATRDLGRPIQAQKAVMKLYWKVHEGEQPQLEDKVWRTMERDVAEYQPYLTRGHDMVQMVKGILGEANTATPKEVTLNFSNYEVTEKGNTLTVKKRDSDRADVILQVQNNRITRSTIETQDVEMFVLFLQRFNKEQSIEC